MRSLFSDSPAIAVFSVEVNTADSSASHTEAFAIKVGQLTALGSSADIKTLLGKGTQTAVDDRHAPRR